jgi:phage tail sheath protein FI
VWRAKFAANLAVLNFPWIRVADPADGELLLPRRASRRESMREATPNAAYTTSPGNEVVRSAIGLEVVIDDAAEAVLNPEGINCIRWFAGRGFRLWGTRTLSADPKWKYVNVRRLFLYLERSIDQGLQWAVFEPNGEVLWENVRRTVSDFLFNEWQRGALVGTKAHEAFFVKCDRSTMTQPAKPALQFAPALLGRAGSKPIRYREEQTTQDEELADHALGIVSATDILKCVG